MPKPDTHETNTGLADQPEGAASEDNEDDHFAAARKFFSGESNAPEESDEKGRTETEDTADAGADELDPLGLLPKKGEEKPEVKGKGEEKPDPDADLQAPPEGSKSRVGWDKLKAQRDAAATKATALEREQEELRKQLDEAKKSAPIDDATKARLAELESQNKVLTDRLKTFDLRSLPEFESKFLAPQNEAKTKLGQILHDEEVEAQVDELLSLKGRKFNEAVSDVLEKLTPFARVKFQSQLDRYLEARAGEESALSQADEVLKSAHQQRAARARAVFDEVGKQFSGSAFSPVTTDEKASEEDKKFNESFNAALATLGPAAERLGLGAIDEPTAAAMAHKAVRYDFFMTHGLPRIGRVYKGILEERAAKITQLEKQVKELSAAKPSLSGGSGAGTPEDEHSEDEDDHLTAARKYFKQ
jgi:hypothetical protein